MSRRCGSLPANYFDRLYAGDPDPWRFATSAYENAKYDATLNALMQPVYRSALEVGCSIGVLTARLAPRCEALLAVDVVDSALAQARLRCAPFSQLRFEKRRMPSEWPDGRYDLIMLSEVLYYLDPSDLAALADRASKAICPGGDIVLVHWLGETDYPQTGDAAAEHFIRMTAAVARPLSQTRTPDYRLDVLRAVDDRED